MNPIVSPSVIYFVGIADVLRETLGVFAVLCLVAFAIALIGYCIEEC